MKNLFLLATAFFMLLACQNSSSQAETETPKDSEKVTNLRQEVMDSHDRTMAKMDDMGRLRNRLETYSKGHADSSKMFAASKQLQRAEDMMMQWMRELEDIDAISSEGEKMSYLKKEKVKMENIETETNDAIDQAQDLLEK